MILLGIDTCGATGTLALARLPDQPMLELLGSAELAGRSAAASLVPELGQMLLNARVSLAEIDGLVVVDGPGSFTGIRIGLGTVKALAEACALPVFAMSRLRVLAAANRLSRAALDAGRGEFYFGSYADEGAGTEQAESEAGTGEWLLTHEELVQHRAQNPALAICEPKLEAVISGARLCAPPSAADAVLAAWPDILAGRRAEIATLDGRYLRRSDLYRLSQPAAL